jgi:hypothetical protein
MLDLMKHVVYSVTFDTFEGWIDDRVEPYGCG